MKIAIIDFGTNTFNLLIADTTNPKKIEYLHSSKHAVKLGKGGITKHILTEEAIDRAMTALKIHYSTIKNYGAEKVYAYATSAVREAKNGKHFLNLVKEEFDLYVNIIPGDREAELIYKGVRQSCKFTEEKFLILDIGGGSNEFIIADKNKIYWKESFKLGMARLLEIFQPEDPISLASIEKIKEYLKQELPELLEAIKIHSPKVLVGASGSFETFNSILQHKKPEKYSTNNLNKEIYMDDYREIARELILSSVEERRIMPGMEEVRVEMINLAAIFVSFTIDSCNLEKIYLSEFALKEGVVAELLNI
ncbi:MAG: hypothetical protein K9H49_15115 [Bacteroidales bacterium]|nr:hypothetical protein [Bacteroidales bacterium]MCF8390768.1 hypothetical protein [Bacteroidales bacterium]